MPKGWGTVHEKVYKNQFVAFGVPRESVTLVVYPILTNVAVPGAPIVVGSGVVVVPVLGVPPDVVTF